MVKNKSFKTNIILCSLIFCACAVLIYLAPYTHDDWAWGSQIGIDRFESNFVDYNGRYFGNYMVLLLTTEKAIAGNSNSLLCCSDVHTSPCFFRKAFSVIYPGFACADIAYA